MSNSREIIRSSGTSVEEAKPRLKKPRMYRVLLMNDDYTPMEFVVTILRKIFRLTEEQSVQIMLKVHTEGSGVCGVFTAEVAETRVREVLALAREHQHPLKCTMEPE
ncbi:MAG: ATP-dependent Clp protease adapter ClpS [Candidatus Thioglobus sp.]|nr:MAG: ATP-dependent Clp protease adapter ClpS [Candidatus Thioglobus sp.]|tara:strand:+ start:397 stop:717 length:321 start_codon:yes stop_codon:yes gene_type:complete